MIRCMLLAPDGTCSVGGEELLAPWQADPGSRLWLDIEGGPSDQARELLLSLDCDELTINDSFKERHPPKLEHFDANTFILYRGITRLERSLDLVPQQIGLWFNDRSLITLHRGHSVSISHFWDNESREPLLGRPGILGLQIVRYACGRYLERLLEFETELGDLEDGLLSERSEDDMKELVAYRSRLRRLRRIFSYHKLMAEHLWRDGGPFLGDEQDESVHVRRSVFDRCERLFSLCDMYYELCGDLIEGYISLSSHHLNQTMKVLTIISALFVPLTFLAGIYGMNFEYMPELGWRYAYFSLLGLMAVITVVMLVVFRRIRWL